MNAAPGFAATLQRVAAMWPAHWRAAKARQRVLQLVADFRHALALPKFRFFPHRVDWRLDVRLRNPRP